MGTKEKQAPLASEALVVFAANAAQHPPLVPLRQAPLHSHPSEPTLLQLLYPPLQVKLQVPVMQLRAELFCVPHAWLHPPQWEVLVLMFVSQPLAAVQSR
jgi:hypothetical protein